MQPRTFLLILALSNLILAQNLLANDNQLAIHSIDNLSNLDIDDLECSQDLQDIHRSVQTWKEIMDKQQQMDSDQLNLEQLKQYLSKFRQGSEQHQSLIQMTTQHKEILLQLRQENAITEFEQWRQKSSALLESEFTILEQAKTQEDIDKCCDKIEKILDKLITEREEIRKQCDQSQVTINIINNKGPQIKRVVDECDESVKVVHPRDRYEVFDHDIQQKSSSSSSSSESEDDEDDGKKQERVSKPQRVFTTNFASPKPALDKKMNSDETFKEYGYGYWARFMTAYPARMISGKNAPWYFLSRLTSNLDYSDLKMGDRLLAIWQGQGYYHFTTCDQPKNEANVIKNIDYPSDIEGVWTYVYYSYSVEKKSAVAFIKYPDSDVQTITHSVSHPQTKVLRFVVGGRDKNRYPGFNGILNQIRLSGKVGAFIENTNQFNQYFRSTKVPSIDAEDLIRNKLISGIVSRDPQDKPDYDQVGGRKQKFPGEYAYSGWFKWEECKQEQWHNLFRVQINRPSTDRYLGDRTLSAWVGKNSGGILHFPTYTYTNMNGDGNPNLVRNIQHKNRHLQWFFVYYGYSKAAKKAFVAVRFSTGIETIEYNQVNHYLAPRFFIFTGKDKQFPGLNGKLGYVNFVMGKGAFLNKPNFKNAQDVFGFTQGESDILKRKDDEPTKKDDKPIEIDDKPKGREDSKTEDKKPEDRKPETKEKFVIQAADPKSYDNKSSEKQPQVDKLGSSEDDLQTYGYGFWMRFLTTYPERLISGKNQPWYFVSRLTWNKEYDNIRMGDRTLAIWQGQGYYHFTTCNVKDGNVNVVQNVNYPEDIDGVWTYVYYSYSRIEEKAVAFIKYGDEEPKQVVHKIAHKPTKQVRFILGGNDEGRYPGFNGLFSKVQFLTSNAFIDELDLFKQQVKLISQPEDKLTSLKSNVLVPDIDSRQPNDEVPKEIIQGGGDNKFPKQYAISGWFKWKPTPQQPWHNIFRVTIKSPSTDQFLGDRTLTLWLGTPEGGILHFPTYSYVNMNGAGNANYYKNIQHKNRHLEWFFVYFGYDKATNNALAYVKWTNSEDSQKYDNVRHYLVPQFYVFVGRDQHFPGFSGKLGLVSFHMGPGAFEKDLKFKEKPGDAFNFNKAIDVIFKKDEPKIDAGEPEKDQLANGQSSKKPVIDKEGRDQKDIDEYGYGFWMRYLTVYPERQIGGKNQPWYFVSRLTQNKEYDNIRMGDRTLAIWQGQGYYHFTTCNGINQNPNVVANINYPKDIEGLWTYIYYSYNDDKARAVGLIKYGDGDIQQIKHEVNHPDTKYVRFILGGNDEGRYPGFNGIFTSVTFGAQKGVYIENPDQLNQLLKKIGTPSSELASLFNTKLVDDVVKKSPKDDPTYKVVAEEKQMFPQEYGISGWFKWQPTAQQPWHNIFRVQIKTPSTDNTLGDRTLTCWLGTPEGGILHFPTYTYTDMNGGGNANYYKNIAHKNRHQKWFFTYFGYSKNKGKAYVYVKFVEGEESLTYDNANHYYVPEFYIFVGGDKQFPGLNGKMGFVSFNAGKGAYRTGNNFKDDHDSFGFAIGVTKIIEKKDVGFKPADADKEVFENKASQEKPVVDKEDTFDKGLEEYGYGFWARYLTAYPERLLAGKNQAWYFVARLTQHKEYDNVRMGDRTLAIWQGQGYYHFTTCNSATNNVNQIQNINYPEDIEGLWTYIYYSYSAEKNKAVAFVKYGDQDFLSAVHETTHPNTKYVRFILGGNDEKRYPGFNGLLTGVTFSAKPGAFVDDVNDLKKYIGSHPHPSVKIPQSNTEFVKDPASRNPNDEPNFKEVGGKDLKFPLEYAISGWFNWRPTAQQPWHNLFRVSIKSPSSDNYLGDRTLTLWLGTTEGGILHFPTYTYSNMNGAGNANYYKNIAHKNRHQEWFFVYFGYSKLNKKAYVYVKWTAGEDSLTYENTNHYLAPLFYVYVGKDKHYPGHSGKMAYFNFNLGEGSYITNNKFDHPKDIFGFQAGSDKLTKKDEKDEKVEPGKPIKEVLSNASDAKKPVVDSDQSDSNNLEEYGYGFWAKFMTAYPNRLLSGKNLPWYFVARLTQHKEYDNIRMGDRTLAIWQGQGYYHFTTCNSIGNNPNVIQNINYPADIEGLWTYIYYSYSDDKSKAVAFIKYGNANIESIRHDVTHPQTKHVRFILGGNDEGRYPGFNGIFTSITFSAKKGVFIDTEDKLKGFLGQLGTPQDAPVKLLNTKLVPDQIVRTDDDEPLYKVIGDEEHRFPTEYAFSGWFKWQPIAQKPWHNIFRVSINTPASDKYLGDRTLTMWLGTTEGGIFHFPTYTYSNMNGAGNANYYKNIQHKNRHLKWFFVYYGYNKAVSKAYVYVKFQDGQETLLYDNANHYFVPYFYVSVGRDKFYPGLNGKQSFVNFNIGKGAYSQGTDFKNDKDIFGFTSGVDKLVKQPDVGFKPEEADKEVRPNAFNQEKPIVDKEAKSDMVFEEYGYGFWLRFLTVYPTRLISGKNAAWYFVSRLTQHKEYDNIRMGDRTLAIWQGQGYYHFTTCNAATNNANQIQNNNYPADIEGLWTYIYYSYDADENKAVAYIKYGNEKLQWIVHQTTHPMTKFLRLIVGGNDEKRYPGFNGVFTSITFSTKQGAFVDKPELVEQYLSRNAAPATSIALTNEQVVKDKIYREVNTQPFEKSVGNTDKTRFPHEYSISGWFKWVEIPQQPWHNIFRVSIKQPSTDQFLGDRTLTCWLGNGILHFPTYTYSNMNGGGNSNHYQNINHKNRHFKWFFVYYGYSKKDANAVIRVKWYDGDDHLNYDKINHYFTPEFFVYVGKDKHFPGFNGQLGQVNFNLGDGAFNKGGDFKHEKNIWGIEAPFAKRSVQPFDPKERETKPLTSGQDQKVPTLEKTFSADDVEDITQYGYGFWCRFLSQYPQQLPSGVTVDWLFMARLTKNEKLNDIGVGDRTLALWFGRGFYHFTTYSGGNPNLIKNVNFLPDIEGVWTFIYHSHHLDKKQSIAFIKQGGEKIVKEVVDATHTIPQYLKFYLGGTHLSYKGYNGQFSDVFVSVNDGIFADKEETIAKLLETLKQPPMFNEKAVTKNVIPTTQTYDAKYEIKENVYEDMALTGEYGWSGWFKWTPCQQQAWHLGVRLSILQKSQNLSFLGDRTLNVWIGSAIGGILHFATYDYANIYGGGNKNSVNNILYKDDLTKWHFMYFGYSKAQKLAYAHVEFKSRTEKLEFKNHHHFIPNKFSLYLARDQWHAIYSGTIGYFRFNAGKGAFQQKDFGKSKDDIFGYGSGKGELIKPVIEFDPEKDREKQVYDSAQIGQTEPNYSRVFTPKELDEIEEYGYGFWCRFLTRYPSTLPSGIQVPWQFMARLTKNEKLGNVGLGDRTLAVWLGRGYYTFTTYSGGNPNIWKNINHPTDIEGVWTFLYHSHSLSKKQSTAFLKFGDSKIQKLVVGATHTVPTYLKFYLSGSQFTYVPFNGQFSDLMLSVNKGVFIPDEESLERLLQKVKKPSDFNLKLGSETIIDKKQSFTPGQNIKAQDLDKHSLVGEYSWSGWFKWLPCNQQPWHLMVRLSILANSENIKFLGDRTLNAWVGKGYFHFTTYTYNNMFGAGNVNVWQNIPYDGDQTEWHFIYFGYSKVEKLAFVRVEFEDEANQLEFKNTNHYLPNTFQFYPAFDKWHTTYSGQIAHLKFHAGEGAFTTKDFDKAPKDLFAFNQGQKEFEKPSKPPVDELRKQEVMDSAFNGEKELVNLEFKEDQMKDVVEYGYGFYIRFMVDYPESLEAGQSAPWYIVSRMTNNEKYDNIRMGDRLMAIWLGRGQYIFVTNHVPGNPNHITGVPTGDIDGVWTFVYFSYSLIKKQAVGIMKFENSDNVHHRVHNVNHNKQKYLRFVFGGRDKWYPGFNGQYANYAVKLGETAFVPNYDAMRKYLRNRIPLPEPDPQQFGQPFKLEEEKTYEGKQQEDDVLTIDEQGRFKQEYSVGAWIKWGPTNLPPWYTVFRLTPYHTGLDKFAQVRFNGLTLYKHVQIYRFHSYSYTNMFNGGNPWTRFDNKANVNYDQWHFVYMAYNRKTKQQYNYIKLVDAEEDSLIKNVNHYMVGKHYFQFGRDFKIYYRHYRGFTGIGNFATLNYGDGAFRIKPLGKPNKLPDVFAFDKGKTQYHPTYELKTVESEDNDKLIEIPASEKKPTISMEIEHGKDDHKITGMDEYGWTLWTRWMRSTPEVLTFRQSWHSLARLTVNKDHKDLSAEGDRTLAVWVGWGFHYFSATGIGYRERVSRINYSTIEGQWVFISFTYKDSVAKGVVYNSETNKIAETDVKGKQRLLNEYLHFVVGGEPWYNGFNGHVAKPIIRLGEGAFLTKDQAKDLADGELKLPKAFQFNQDRKTFEIQKEKEKFESNDKGEAIELKEDILGKREYSISGWFRWVDGPRQGASTLFRVASLPDKDIKNARQPGDQVFTTFLYANNPTYYHITTYTINELNGGNWNVHGNMNFARGLHTVWTYIYEGYSKEKQQLFAYVKFPTGPKTLIHKNVNHYHPAFFTVLIHKDPHYPGWNGFREAFYLNVGKGSYIEKGFGEGESDLTFGFGGRTISPLKNWKHDDMIQSDGTAKNEVGAGTVYEDDDSVNGLTEYGYGMWTRFAWNGPGKIINKPQWMGVSRLTSREKDDNIGLPIDSLALYLGTTFFHFCTTHNSAGSICQNIDFGIMLDGQWNYIYFSYKMFPNGGRTQGYVLFDGSVLRATKFPRTDHPAVSDFLTVSFGNMGKNPGVIKRFPNWNGQMAKMSLNLGDGAYIADPDVLRKQAPEKPVYPKLKAIKKLILDEQKDMKRADAKVDPYIFGEAEGEEGEDYEFDGAIEYSVSLWYKWSTIGRVAWEVIYTLGYHEPKLTQNHVKPGDRQLSMFQAAQHQTYFQSYTTPNNHQNFQQVYTMCQVPPNDQTQWVYGYYAYSRKEGSLVSFLKTKSTDCEKKISAMHRVPKQFTLFLGKNGIQTPYNGKFAKVYLMAGPGSFIDSGFKGFGPFIDGASGVQSKPYEYKDKKDLFEQPFDENIEIELDGGKIDGHSSYGYGLWTRYLTAIPKRLMEKPAIMSVARLTINEDHKDYASIGDRTLALFIGRGQYLFRTYNQANNSPNLGQDIDYGTHLEGEWNFLYFSYSGSKQQATGFLKFGLTDQVIRIAFPNIAHKPLENYCKLVIGKEFSYKGFNGQIQGLQILFGTAAFVNDEGTLNKLIDGVFPEPKIPEKGSEKITIQGEEKVKKADDAPQMEEWEDEYEGVLEYSVFGWFRYANPKLAKDNNVFLRLTNNEKAYRKEFGQIGDRTLLIMLQPREVVYATYTMGKIDSGAQHNIRKPVKYGDNFGLWTYVWMGYSWHKKQASGVVKFPSNTEVVPYPNVLHMVPKYLALFAGSDGMLGGWVGPMQKVGAIFGKGAYVDTNKGNYVEFLPDFTPIGQTKYQWKPEKEDEITYSPAKDDKPAFDIELKEEVAGVSEYAYGLWTRWLMTTPERVADKSPFHHLIRMTSTEKYEDNAQLGNRVLATWVGKGYYHFTTYDKATNKISISQNADYGDLLEGHWNYIYFSFTAKGKPRAVGFVHFGDAGSNQVSRVEFMNLVHDPLNGYARIVVANKEFSYPAFNGMLSDLRIYLGQGFVGSKEQLLKDVIQTFPKPILKLPIRTDINVLKEQKNFEKGDDKAPIKTEYDQYQGVLEYAVSGWVQAKKFNDDVVRSLFRLTINAPGFQKDKHNAGDRTLAGFLTKDSYMFSTYDYGNLDTNDDDQNDINKYLKQGNNQGEWTYIYFGYNLKLRKAICYALFVNREDSATYDGLKHFVPNKFWFYLGNDGHAQQYEGVLYNWNLNMGDGAFTYKPKSMIELWPYEPTESEDKVMSALLGNQGLSSVKLIKNQPLSGGVDAGSGPLSGGLDVAEGPKSGGIDQMEGAKSGELDVMGGAKSGELEKEGGAKSGDFSAGDGAKSGDFSAGEGAKSGDFSAGEGAKSGDFSAGEGAKSGNFNAGEGAKSGGFQEGQKSQSGEFQKA